ncbi:MAG: hypothetical protein CR985_00120 [Flavobacteriales bacterium]|nr:MAG: hypothetical protein CR985_00120 [Flavobacteriales bacterium]
MQTIAQSVDIKPDYTTIRFYSKVKDYKKGVPDIEKIQLKKADLNKIVSLLGEDFYTDKEITAITDKVWLALIDPKKFDYVFKDIAVQSIPNWNKKNFKGEIVIEPNPFLAKWTTSQNDIIYFKEALGQLLTHFKLMAYSEEAKDTKKALKRMFATENYKFRPIRGNDWPSFYLNSVNAVINPKKLTALMSNFDFFICKSESTDTLIELFAKMDWHFCLPEK